MTNYQKKYLKYKKKYLEAKKMYGGEKLEKLKELIEDSIITDDIYINSNLDDYFFQMVLINFDDKTKKEAVDEMDIYEREEVVEGGVARQRALRFSDEWRLWADEKNKAIKIYELQAFKNYIEKEEISCVAEALPHAPSASPAAASEGGVFDYFFSGQKPEIPEIPEKTQITPEAAEKIVNTVTDDRFNYIDQILLDLINDDAILKGSKGKGVQLVAQVLLHYYNQNEQKEAVPDIGKKKEDWKTYCELFLSLNFVPWDKRQKDN